MRKDSGNKRQTFRGAAKKKPTDGKRKEPKIGGGSDAQMGAKVKAKKKVIMIKHKLGEDIEDNFEEFEELKLVGGERDVDDKLTIWMNSWMDEDDWDFREMSESFKNTKRIS